MFAWSLLDAIHIDSFDYLFGLLLTGASDLRSCRASSWSTPGIEGAEVWTF